MLHARAPARRRSTTHPSPVPTLPRGRMVLNKDVDVLLSEAMSDEDWADGHTDADANVEGEECW